MRSLILSVALMLSVAMGCAGDLAAGEAEQASLLIGAKTGAGDLACVNETCDGMEGALGLDGPEENVKKMCEASGGWSSCCYFSPLATCCWTCDPDGFCVDVCWWV
jgi:hypothetical protein